MITEVKRKKVYEIVKRKGMNRLDILIINGTGELLECTGCVADWNPNIHGVFTIMQDDLNEAICGKFYAEGGGFSENIYPKGCSDYNQFKDILLKERRWVEPK